MTAPTAPGSGSDRRQFERLDLSDDAFAVDASGRELGKVTQASGGGMMIKPKSADIATSLPVGERVTITVMEPGSQTRASRAATLIESMPSGATWYGSSCRFITSGSGPSEDLPKP